MKKKYFRNVVASLLALNFIASCSSSSDNVVAEQTLGYCLSYAQDQASRAQSFDHLSFAAQFNYSNYTVDLTITGIVLPQAGSTTGQRIPKMTFSGLSWQYNKYGWKVIDCSNQTPEIVGVTNAPLFKNLTFMVLDVFDGTTYAPGIQYEFVVANPMDTGESSAKIVGCCMKGKTVSSNPEGVSYSPEEDATVADKNKPTYWIDFDFESSTADIYLYNAKFISNMPSLNLVFPGVGITVDNDLIELKSYALTPEYDNIPFDAFPISQLRGTVDFISGSTLEFHCNYRGTDFTVKFEGKY